MQEFSYLRRKFKPIGTLPENASFHSITLNCRSIGINNYDGGKYSHKDFYRAAIKAGCGTVDLFETELNSKTILVIPCENELFEFTEEHKLTADI